MTTPDGVVQNTVAVYVPEGRLNRAAPIWDVAPAAMVDEPRNTPTVWPAEFDTLTHM